MWTPPVVMVENSTCRSPTHVSPDALVSHKRGVLPTTGTTHVSHTNSLLMTVYATRELSGAKTGLIFADWAEVSGTALPPGSSFRYPCPGPSNVLAPRMSVSNRPSGESAGEVAASAKY